MIEHQRIISILSLTPVNQFKPPHLHCSAANEVYIQPPVAGCWLESTNWISDEDLLCVNLAPFIASKSRLCTCLALSCQYFLVQLSLLTFRVDLEMGGDRQPIAPPLTCRKYVILPQERPVAWYVHRHLSHLILLLISCCNVCRKIDYLTEPQCIEIMILYFNKQNR